MHISVDAGRTKIDQICENAPNLWTGFATSDHMATKLHGAKYSDASGVRGAGWLRKNAAPPKR
jgi:hypothetical protein